MSRKERKDTDEEVEIKDGKREFEKGKSSSKRNQRKRGGKRRNAGGRRGNDDYNSGGNGSKSTPLCSKSNDVTWYTKSPLQVKNAASLSFLTATGKPTNQFDNVYGLVATNKFGAPGVLVMNYIPTFGNPQEPHDPLNYAINILYNDLRYKNSGATNYEAQDYMGYIMAMDSAYSFAGYMTRIYGLVNSYSSLNRYWPGAILEALHVDVDTFKYQLPAFRQMINNYIARINTMAVPTVLPIIQRHFWMNANVYKDAESNFAQVYVNNPLVYGVKDYESGDLLFKSIGKSKTTSTKVTDITFDRLGQICDEITAGLLFDEDYNIMSGDTIKKWGNSLFQVSFVEDNQQLYPVYDAAVLIQIMNSRAGGYLATLDDDGAYHAVYNEGTVIYHLHDDVSRHCFTLSQMNTRETRPLELLVPHRQSDTLELDYDMFNTGRKTLINIPTDDVSPEHILEATRCTANYIYQTDPTAPNQQITALLAECGVDIYTTFDMYVLTLLNDGYMSLKSVQPFCSLKLNTGTDTEVALSLNTDLNDIMLLDSFDWHPVIQIMNETSVGGERMLFALPPFVDQYNVAMVTSDVLARIHEVANFSLFNITEKTSYSS